MASYSFSATVRRYPQIHLKILSFDKRDLWKTIICLSQDGQGIWMKVWVLSVTGNEPLDMALRIKAVFLFMILAPFWLSGGGGLKNTDGIVVKMADTRSSKVLSF